MGCDFKMKFKLGFIFICLIICLFGIASVCAIEGVNHTQEIESCQSDEINLTDDLKATEDSDNEILTADEGSFEQLNGELQGKSHYTLTRDYRYVYDDGDRFVRGIKLENTITIDGAGHKIDGSGIARIFNVAADNVILKNITFKNGRTTQDGGAVYFARSGSVINCTFADNSAVYHGGAVKFSSTGNVTDCNFINNTGYRGGAVFFLKEGIIKNSNFDDNTGRYGGAVHFGDYGEAVNCNFTDNSVFADDENAEGGAIVFSKYGAAANCNFVDNVACYYGAIKFEGLGTITYCNFTRNQGKGGAVLFNSFGSLAYCNFVDNVNTGGNGGAVCFAFDSECIVENCNFDYNEATGDGGAVWMYFGRLINCNFTDNQATGNGGAVHFYEQGTLTNCNFANNHVTGTDSYGGAIYFAENSNCNVGNCNFTNNKATGDYSYGGAIYVAKNSNGNVANCNFTDNNASDYGGAICFDDDSTGNVTNCNFTGNNVMLDGGAICFKNSGTVINCSFADNCALRDGGAVFIFSSGSVVNSDFKNNAAYGGGAIIFFDEGSVENSNFTNNKATFHAGAVFFTGEGEATNCNFINNSAINSGGAIRFSGKGNVSNSNFTDNAAFKDGGAIYFLAFGNVTDCNFINNNASNEGGAINLDAGIVSNCSFINNSAEYGGAVSAFECNVSNCNFTDNSADNGGAVKFVTSGTAVNCNFTGNSATNQGGAVYLNDGDVVDCNFINNTADNLGGAIYVYSGSVEGCNFTHNSAEYGGAVLFNDRGSGNVTNCNFDDNQGIGGAIYSMEQYTTADTCIFKTQTDTTNDKVIILSPTLNVDNFTTVYNSGEKLTLDLKTNSGKPVGNGNISISVYYKDNDTWFDNYSCLSGEGWAADLPVGSYYAVFNTEYAGFNAVKRAITVIPNIPYYANVTSLATNNRTVNITAKSNVPQDMVQGKLLFILPNGDVINATYDSNGTWWAVHTFDDYGDYQVNASYIGLDNVAITNATISITKANSTVNVSDVVLDYGDSRNVTVTAEGATGITAKIDGEPVDVIDNFTIPISGLAAGNYTLTVTTIADEDHNNVTKTVNITVNKVNSTLTLDNVVLDYGDSKIVTVEAEGATGITAKIDGEPVDVIDNFTIPISGLAAGNYTLTVTTIADGDHINVTKTVNITVKKAHTEISVATNAVDLKVLQEFAAGATLTPVDAGNLTYTSSNSTVAIVEDGKIKALVAGTTAITVSFAGNNNYAAAENKTISVTVKLKDASVSVKNDTLVLKVNDEKKLVFETTPEGLEVTFESDNPDVATVSLLGKVEGHSVGTATITLKVGDGKVYAENSTTVTVTVTLNDASVSVDNDTLNLKVDDMVPLDVTTVPEGLNVTYETSNPEVASVSALGKVTAHKEGTATITVKVGDDKIYAINSTNVTVTVSRMPTEITSAAITTVYNVNKDLVITLKDGEGNAMSGVKLTVNLNGAKEYTTDKNGQVKVATKGLAAKTYAAKITFNGNTKYGKSTKEVKVTVKKAKPKITAKKKTFKRKVKTKKYTITLKNNLGKAIKKAKVTIKIKKKTYKATTNAKGKAVFKIKKLTKKGKYKAVITYKGNTCYNKVTKKVKITVK